MYFYIRGEDKSRYMVSHMARMALNIFCCIFRAGSVDRIFLRMVGKAHRTLLDSDVNKQEDGCMGFGKMNVNPFACSRRIVRSTGDRKAAFLYTEQDILHHQQIGYKASSPYDHTRGVYLRLHRNDISSKAHHRHLDTCAYISVDADKVPYRLHFYFESMLGTPCDHRDVFSQFDASTSCFHTVDYKVPDMGDHSSDFVGSALDMRL